MAPEKAHRFLTWSAAASARYGVEQALVLAVIAKESSFLYFGNAGSLRRLDSLSPRNAEKIRRSELPLPRGVVNPLEPHGPMQVAGRWHPEKMPVDAAGEIRPTTLRENVAAGTWVLSEYIRRDGGNLVRALQRYNGDLGDLSARYARHVLALRESMRQTLQDSDSN